MRTHKWIFRASLFGLVGSLMACSGVEFNPVELTKNESLTSGKPTSESFYPNPSDSAPKVDVLFVIDNSASMRDEQLKLGDRLSAFVDHLSDVDWQVGITTTDTSDGPFGLKGSLVQLHGLNQYILTKNTPNYKEVFANTVVRPEGVNCGSNCPSIVERPLEAAMLALAKGEASGFIRPGAELAIVILSDADEGGDGSGDITTPQFLLGTAASVFNQEKRITGYGIIVEPGDADCLNQQRQFSPNSFYGYNAAMLAHLTGGVTGNICDNNYSHSLKKIGEHVLHLVSTLTLSHQPLRGSVQVTLTPEDPSIKWTLDGKNIEFNKPPKPGTRVDVNYLIEE